MKALDNFTEEETSPVNHLKRVKEVLICDETLLETLI